MNRVYVVACQRESRVGHYYYIKHSYLLKKRGQLKASQFWKKYIKSKKGKDHDSSDEGEFDTTNKLFDNDITF